MWRCCPASPTQSDYAHSLRGIENQAQLTRAATQTRIPRSQDKSGRQSQTSCFLTGQRVLKMKEGCTCLLDASQTLTSHKRVTSSCTPQGFCLCPRLHFICWLSHASLLQRYPTQEENRSGARPAKKP